MIKSIFWALGVAVVITIAVFAVVIPIGLAQEDRRERDCDQAGGTRPYPFERSWLCLTDDGRVIPIK